jgi:cation transport ATPase
VETRGAKNMTKKEWEEISKSEWYKMRTYVTKHKAVILFVVTIVIIGLGLIGLSLSDMKLDSPDQWLKDWTAWVAQYVALVVAAIGIVNVANSAASRLRHGTLDKD